jgi:hypothetical protein
MRRFFTAAQNVCFWHKADMSLAPFGRPLVAQKQARSHRGRQCADFIAAVEDFGA